MRTKPLQEISLTLLQDDVGLCSLDVLESTLARCADAHGFQRYGLTKMVQQDPATHTAYAMMIAGPYRVLISQTPEPLDPSILEPLGKDALNLMLVPDLSTITARHRTHTSITIGSADNMKLGLDSETAEKLDQITGDLLDSPSMDSWREINGALSIARDFSASLFADRSVSAVINGATGQVFSPEVFFAYMDADPKMLMVRPIFVSSSGRLGPGLPVGAVVPGVAHVLGRAFIFNEVAVEPGDLLNTLNLCVAYCHDRGALVGHGETFSLPDASVFLVTHHPADGRWNEPYVAITARRWLKYGIDDPDLDLPEHPDEQSGGSTSAPDLAPDFHDDGPVELDPNDPIDAAILERLEAARSEQDAAASSRSEPAERKAFPPLGGGKSQTGFGMRKSIGSAPQREGFNPSAFRNKLRSD